MTAQRELLLLVDKEPLTQTYRRRSRPRRFAFTLEEGQPLTEAERQRMPDADAVWLTPQEMLVCLQRARLTVGWKSDCSRSHRARADALISVFAADVSDIAARSDTGL